MRAAAWPADGPAGCRVDAGNGPRRKRGSAVGHRVHNRRTDGGSSFWGLSQYRVPRLSGNVLTQRKFPKLRDEGIDVGGDGGDR